MNWFTDLKNAALDFLNTPVGERLAFGDTPTAAPAKTTENNNWLWLIVGGVVLVVVLVLVLRK